VHKAN